MCSHKVYFIFALINNTNTHTFSYIQIFFFVNLKLLCCMSALKYLLQFLFYWRLWLEGTLCFWLQVTPIIIQELPLLYLLFYVFCFVCPRHLNHISSFNFDLKDDHSVKTYTVYVFFFLLRSILVYFYF